MAAQRSASASDLSDAEWQILAPLLPSEKPGGRPRQYAMREVLNGIHYVLRAGCAWRLMPHDLPHWQTADPCFRAWRRDGTWRRFLDQRHDRVCTHMGRHPPPSAEVSEAPPVQTTAKGGPTAMTARSNSTAASAIASLRRRVACGVSSSTPPI
jgi:putative transposase